MKQIVMTKQKRPLNSTIGDVVGLRDIIEKINKKPVSKFNGSLAKGVPKNKRKNPKADK